MAKNDPSFIRLSDARRRGICADLNSGFSISGRDVQPFPSDRARAKFVRKKMSESIIEPASKAEYDEIVESNATSSAPEDGQPHQEHRIWEQQRTVADAKSAAAAEKKSKKKDKKAAKKAAAESSSDDSTTEDVSNDEDGSDADSSTETTEEEKTADAAAKTKKAAAKKAPAKAKAAAKKRK